MEKEEIELINKKLSGEISSIVEKRLKEEYKRIKESVVDMINGKERKDEKEESDDGD